jgi:chromosome segregation ATPase
VTKSEAEATKWKAKVAELAENAEAAADTGSRNLSAREEADAQLRECHATIERMKDEIAALKESLQRSSQAENDAKGELKEFRHNHVELQGTLKEMEWQQKETSAEVHQPAEDVSALRTDK